ncbi:uncharacterized protein LOC113220340 isoform X3 [Piliocolobus tephrosceles]|uniref:uncharacterized protein LOC113220340 isoform X3 n=1 Tax=Piliocolobus tephrosceles TaxID=591936 RepID=UPI000E6AECB3|nr:uncharacterized protein LOC113220340 isoform X3 [Piliocolobus tephrosceles]
MDADDSRSRKGSLRKFLEHLSGAGKAIGVLTSCADAQDVHTEAVQVALAKPKEHKMAGAYAFQMQVPGRADLHGCLHPSRAR